MFQIFTNINVDWMGWRKPLIAVSILILVAGLASAIGRQATEGGTDAFNLGVDFQGGTVITAKFKEKPSVDAIREALNAQGINEPIIQDSTDKTDEVLIKVPLFEDVETGQSTAAPSSAETANVDLAAAPENGQPAAPASNTQVDRGRQTVKRLGPLVPTAAPKKASFKMSLLLIIVVRLFWPRGWASFARGISYIGWYVEFGFHRILYDWTTRRRRHAVS